MTDKSCCWSITINNPTDDDHLQWANMTSFPWVKEVTGQLEKGEEGTVHIQGMVRTTSVRFAALKKALPRAHIEVARNQAALTKYVSKVDTRIGPTVSVKTATQADLQMRLLTVILEEFDSAPETSGEMLEFVTTHSAAIKKQWEYYLDKAVNILILKGYFGVEFVVSNPQIRLAFKKYLPSVLYRTYNARNEIQETIRSQEREEAGST